MGARHEKMGISSHEIVDYVLCLLHVEILGCRLMFLARLFRSS